MQLARKRLLIAVALTMMATVAVAGEAGAKPPAEREIEAHCVVYVVDKTADGELETTSPECFGTETEAMLSAATLADSADTGGGGFALSSSTFVLGIHYDGQNGTGSSITVVGTSCTGGHWNTPGWFDNRISSSYNGCARLRHYNLPNKRGSGVNNYGAGDLDNVAGFMNNKTESVAYYSS